jgi:hypothetical protein
MRTAVVPTLTVLTLLSRFALAEEGGTGHYLPGAMSSFVDGVPAEEAFIARYNFAFWDAQAGAQRELPIAGPLTAGAPTSPATPTASPSSGGRLSAISATPGRSP